MNSRTKFADQPGGRLGLKPQQATPGEPDAAIEFLSSVVIQSVISNTVMRRIIAIGLLFWTTAAPALAAGGGRVDFNFQVRPLLSDRCFRCHGPDSAARKAKLRLDTRDGALRELEDGWVVVKPGQPGRSELIRRIFTDNEDDLMPPPDSHLSLSSAEKELLKRWVSEGAEYQSHWAFLPVGKITPPVPARSKWVRNPIDAFVLSRLQREKLSPAPQASREILIRRLAFNLTGLPPTLAELDAFLADKSPDAYEKVVAHFLNSPAYGERMALDWLDLARYADTYGYQADVERDMSPWRDWVIQAFNENLPYDQFLTWQLAGDLLPNPTREQRLATAFNRLHRQTNEGGSVEEEFRAEYAMDRVNTVGMAMLGLTMECARCHDHKFDPIKQTEYFSFLAFFNSIDESGLYSHFTRATPTPTLLLWSEDQEKQHAALKARIAAVENQLAIASPKTAERALPQPIAHFAFDTVISNATPDSVNLTNLAKLVDGPVIVPTSRPGSSGRESAQHAPAESQSRLASAVTNENFALQFSGDNEVVCQSVPNFKRTDEFSFTLRLKPTEPQDRAVVLHQSRAWSDSGSRGFELVLEQGKPFFGLIHFWPGNAIAVRARQELPRNEWSKLTVTYDGSSRAAGIRLYRNGKPLETEVVRDHLYKDIVHRAEWGDAEAGSIRLQLAGRFRDSGFKNGLIDDLQVFNVALTDAEVAATPSSQSSQRADHGASPLSAELKRLRQQENDLINDIPEIMVMEEMPTSRVTHRLNRGAYDAPAEVVERATPGWLLPFPQDQPRDRLGLARWTTDRNNPLTARVVVNRIWRMHFGSGLVASQEDFGSQGKLPTHPELLDWLAGWFMDQGWDVKALHKLIVRSATFQQSSQAKREVIERDPDNRLLARGPKTRLLAEEIRDSALAASGLLNRQIGGPSVKPYQPEGLWEASGTGKTYTPDHGEKLYRRSLYTFWRRTAPPPSMLTFDAMSREVCTAKRESTATPLQSLVLLNDPQFLEAARVLAQKLLKQFPNDEAGRNREAFRALTGRVPDKAEARILAQLYAEQRAEFTKHVDDAKKLLAVGESKHDESLPPVEFAAMTAVVNTIMNFDEFVVQR